jgi:hypothetical protein
MGKEEGRPEKTERQMYYEELVAYIVQRDYGVTIDFSKETEVPPPRIRTDMLFEIPKENLAQAKMSHLPCLAEVSLVHIKAVNDRLTQDDVIQYLGELYLVAMKAKAKGKSASLIILSAERILPSVTNGLIYEIKATENPSLFQIGAQISAYIYVLEGLPKSGEYWYFLPFQPVSVLKAAKQEIREIAKQSPGDKEKAMFLFWLKKLQPDFYEKEIGMPVDTEEIARDVFPKTLQKKKNEGMRETIIKVLHARFGLVPQEIKDKLELIDSLQALDIVINGAATVPTLEGFKRLLE